MAVALSEIEKKVFEKFKIIEVNAEDCLQGSLYILAPSIKIAEEKAVSMTYRGVKGREIAVNDEIRNMRYYKDAIEWASKHEQLGYASADAFWFNSFHDEEAEKKEREEARAKQEFYRMLLWPFIPR